MILKHLAYFGKYLPIALLHPRLKSIVAPRFYAEKYVDVPSGMEHEKVHFLNDGAREGRRPNPWFSPAYVHNSLHQNALHGLNAETAYIESDMSERSRLVFVSHEASRTGAPAIILRLLEMFSQCEAFECFTILDKGGDRLEEFEAVSHTFVKSHERYNPAQTDVAASEEIASLFSDGIFSKNRPILALVNSAESLQVGRVLNQLNLPVYSLVHEIAAYYNCSVFQEILDYSRKLIFPSQFVRDTALGFMCGAMEKSVVRGQGLLEEDFGKLKRAPCRELLRESLKLPSEALVVLSVGTMDIRKGFDLFVSAARLYLTQNPSDTTTHFVWFGHMRRDHNIAATFAKAEITTVGLEGRIHLRPPTPEIEQVYVGADLFLLTARADPFPCVVHEAMACGLPIIAFENGGGAPELIGDDCGTVVPMGDLSRIVAALETYIGSPATIAEHAKNATTKIRSWDWSFDAYFEDIWRLLAQDSALPNTPEIYTQPQAEAHLLVMERNWVDFHTLERLDDQILNVSKIALLGGRFAPDAPAVAARLKMLGNSVHICQPLADTQKARRDTLHRLMFKPRPNALTLIGYFGPFDAERLAVLSCPKRLILPNDHAPLEEVKRSVSLFDDVQVAEIVHMRVEHLFPEIAAGLTLLPAHEITELN